MPATGTGKPEASFVLGVDGCPAGWVFARLEVENGALQAGITKALADLITGPGADALAVMIDIPIGLADRGRRKCEALARRLLAPKRHSSVFSTPRRPMLAFADYETANVWGKAQGSDAGGGLSKQAWMITPKIREADTTLHPADQARIGEAHPEVAFWRLNGGAPCTYGKRTTEGAAERLALLTTHGLTGADRVYNELRKAAGAGVARDDVYDACALALTAKARLAGDALRLTDGAQDARGLVMEIWG